MILVVPGLTKSCSTLSRSIYQDIPLYSEEEFVLKAPESMRTEETLEDEHVLMLSRLNFELMERQRYPISLQVIPTII